MSLIEEQAYQVLREIQNPDNRPLKELMRGRSVSYRQAILRQLQKWDVADHVNTRILKVNPKPRKETTP